jgi:hypothetical protein
MRTGEHQPAALIRVLRHWIPFASHCTPNI